MNKNQRFIKRRLIILYVFCNGAGLALLVATLVRSTKLLYAGPG